LKDVLVPEEFFQEIITELSYNFNQRWKIS